MYGIPSTEHELASEVELKKSRLNRFQKLERMEQGLCEPGIMTLRLDPDKAQRYPCMRPGMPGTYSIGSAPLPGSSFDWEVELQYHLHRSGMCLPSP